MFDAVRIRLLEIGEAVKALPASLPVAEQDWERIVRAAEFDIDLSPRLTFREATVTRDRAAYVPAALPRLPLDRAFGRVCLPLHLNWSQPGREFNLSDRRERARVYGSCCAKGPQTTSRCTSMGRS